MSVYKQKEFPFVYKEKPSGVLVNSDNQNIHQFLHRLALKQTINNLRLLHSGGLGVKIQQGWGRGLAKVSVT